MQRPQQIEPSSLADYLDVMSRAIFSAGMNWKVIEAKWEGSRAAFDGFNPDTVAAYTPDDVERLMTDPRVIHNRKKIDAIVANAGELIVTDRECGGLEQYFASFADNDELVADLHKRFKFLGVSVAHHFLFVVGVNSDAQEKWAMEQFAATRARS